MYGIVTPTGLALHHNGRSVPLPVTSVTPLGVAVREACAAILAGELEPCRWCDSIAPCDCLRWHEYMLLDADPHGDLSVFDDCEIPY